MTRRGKGGLLCWLALPLLFAAGYCFYKAIDAGITSEEGIKYSLPVMKSSQSYSKKDVEHAESEFRNLDRLSNEWGDGAAGFFLLSVISGIAGILILRLGK